MISQEDMARRAKAQALFIAGSVSIDAATAPLPDWAKSVILLSPDEPSYWPFFSQSPEYLDGHPDPADRWSARVVGDLAQQFGGMALFPSDGPPYPPFVDWAFQSGQTHSSPINLLVHNVSGLFISFRGAIALPFDMTPTNPQPSPCTGCAAPCLTACPIDALNGDGYDVPACKSYLETPDGQACYTGGCLSRRACPVGQDRRIPDHSAFHMKAFHPDAATT